MELAELDIESATVKYYPDAVQKLVQGVGISPDGLRAVVVHRPDSNPQNTDPYALQVAKDQGYSMFDLASSAAQLKRTGTVAVQGFAFAPQGGAAAVSLSDPTNKVYGVNVLDLRTLVANSLSLPSAPEFVGAIPQPPGSTADPSVWVTQVFTGGRISFVDLSNLALTTVGTGPIQGEQPGLREEGIGPEATGQSARARTRVAWSACAEAHAVVGG